MRILLDESVPWRLGPMLTGHTATSVQRHGWAGISNGRLLALAAGDFDVLLTADKGMEHQQNLDALPMAVLPHRTPYELVVFAVAHFRRHPSYWRLRSDA